MKYLQLLVLLLLYFPAALTTNVFELASLAASQALVSFEELQYALLGTYPDTQLSVPQFNSFLQALVVAGVQTKMEAAFFLAHVLWESDGLTQTAEVACVNSGCPGQYRMSQDPSDKFYYGRGYLQLSWSYNYKACSEALFGDDSLLQNPDWVAEYEVLSWLSAAWFWSTVVHPTLARTPNYFGVSTQLINGAMECKRNGKNGPRVAVARSRWQLLRSIAQVLGVSGMREDGCYNGRIPAQFNN